MTHLTPEQSRIIANGKALPEDDWERSCNSASSPETGRPYYKPHMMKSDLRKAIKLIRRLRRENAELAKGAATARDEALEEAAKAVLHRLKFRSCTCCSTAMEAIRALSSNQGE